MNIFTVSSFFYFIYLVDKGNYITFADAEWIIDYLR